jgi:uncharacterized protein YecT (DUF1311 family)
MSRFTTIAWSVALLSAMIRPCLAQSVFIMPSAEKCMALPNVESWSCLNGVIVVLNATLQKYYEASRSNIQKSAADAKDMVAQDLNDAIGSLRDAQSSWRSYRDAHCDMVGQLFTNGSGKVAGEYMCVIELTRHRIHELWEVRGFGNSPSLPEPK